MKEIYCKVCSYKCRSVYMLRKHVQELHAEISAEKKHNINKEKKRLCCDCNIQ